mmetsp:Transcript_7198/g.10704  ORF Transcript_7198/g.10704 Transcript_7198/m.10704 type:complete len:665 (-) Transcript_7198:135-2129(-)|eukprot:CAMPEP_0185040130 /NCGR_PEP_ID=MMETSP1103-20130426/37832_1 /TAXON_ID=36769 /ORGANISM="Paraphysomonas bandaiensis, Strain Caron Lab Isolate" /LENGTH=664 /DNA_ID=CAMNT_0027579309 /DNA_START=30 /DNA_END=2024 /DNA_ORIENTATION=-
MSDTGKGTVDLLNVDYEDVLHLYRGWRHAEGQLKDKNKELNALKNRIKQLQDSHVKFRGQIQALESVKELTVTLKTQLAALEEENKQLIIENSTLSEVNNQAEELLVVGETSSKKLSSQLNKVSLEAAEYKGRCEELTSAQAQFEAVLSEEQAARLSAESRLKSMEKQVEQLVSENREYKWKLDTAQSKLEQCDRELAHAAQQLSDLSEEVANIATMKEKVQFAESEKNVLKGDITRLLRLLEHYPAARGFLKQWQDSEGMSFTGNLHTRPSKEMDILYDDYDKKSECSITPHELAHLRRVHGVEHDTHVMFSTMEEELEHWSPQEAVLHGFEFLTNKVPSAPVDILQTFIRRMNKIWLRREKRKVHRIKEKYEGRISDLKRQLSNAKPYHGVMAERKIRCLNNQVKTIRGKKLTGRPKVWTENDSDDDDLYLYEQDVGEDESRSRKSTCAAAEVGWVSTTSKSSRSHSQPPCSRCVDTSPSTTHKSRGNTLKKFDKISAKELLGASLNSLEAVGRHNNTQQKLVSFDLGNLGGSASSMHDHLSEPSAEYLRGALWLGRNMLMITEETVEQLDLHRSQFLREVSSVAREDNSSRAAHRLSLLAASGITDALSTVYQSRAQSRKMLQDAAAISPGDKEAMRNFLMNLPVESLLSQSFDRKDFTQE